MIIMFIKLMVYCMKMTLYFMYYTLLVCSMIMMLIPKMVYIIIKNIGGNK